MVRDMNKKELIEQNILLTKKLDCYKSLCNLMNKDYFDLIVLHNRYKKITEIIVLASALILFIRGGL